MAASSSTDKTEFFKETIRTLVSVVEYKSEYYRGHSERVAANGIRFGKLLRQSQDFINSIYLSGLLYDIGMVYIPLEIINKSEKLSEEEFQIVREHPVIAEKILSHLHYLKPLLPIIRHHHENYDGSGYPDGLKGDQIPLGARILSILDGFDAMISPRPHRPALGLKETLEQIHKGRGTIYDPQLADEFIRFIVNKDASPPEKEADAKAESAPAQASHAKPAGRPDDNPIQKAVNDVVQAFKRGVIEIPAFPMVIQKIQQALQSPDRGLEDLARIIEQDQVVTLRLLSAAKSAHYGGDTNIQSVTQALSRIGMKDSQNIISAIAMKSMYESSSRETMELMEKFWVHAVATAHMARAIARQLRERDEDALFLLGLTHDVGKVLLFNALAKRLFKNGEQKIVETESLLTSIQAVHANFGGALLKRWGFKYEFVSAVSNHEHPDFSSGSARTNLILYLANILTRRIGYSLFEEQPSTLGQVIAYLELEESAIATLLEDTKKIVQKTTGT